MMEKLYQQEEETREKIENGLQKRVIELMASLL